jgi:hypothetical protein
MLALNSARGLSFANRLAGCFMRKMVKKADGNSKYKIWCSENCKKACDREVQNEVGQNGLLQGAENRAEESVGSFSLQEKMGRFYLDSNILIAHYSVDRAEAAKKELVENALDAYDQLNEEQRHHRDFDIRREEWF